MFDDYDSLNIPVTGQQGEPIRAWVIDFLTNGLTDPRVANETPPFDRPTLFSEMGPENEIYCDFNYLGMENGTLAQPYDTVEESLVHIAEHGTVHLAPGAISGAMTIDQSVTLIATSGPVLLGN